MHSRIYRNYVKMSTNQKLHEFSMKFLTGDKKNTKNLLIFNNLESLYEKFGQN